jgi:UDP:flavonoid glycosyltransferase YjiC (YdhE family)
VQSAEIRRMVEEIYADPVIRRKTSQMQAVFQAVEADAPGVRLLEQLAQGQAPV